MAGELCCALLVRQLLSTVTVGMQKSEHVVQSVVRGMPSIRAHFLLSSEKKNHSRATIFRSACSALLSESPHLHRGPGDKKFIG